ncbi:kinase-like protein [Pluteus cervinus]|uniref:Kinase-like protein n=1 Tax=Pluteus cervinus TaxID=181527 RepID=A0ACD3AAI7_9AGAR|nr:kinase-like protein [Pluteus cervinus]
MPTSHLPPLPPSPTSQGSHPPSPSGDYDLEAPSDRSSATPSPQHLIVRDSPVPFTQSYNGELYNGSLIHIGGGTLAQVTNSIVIKILQGPGLNKEDMTIRNAVIRRLYACAESWKRLRHPNILSVHSLVETQDELAFVLPWYPRGNITTHLRQREHASALRDKLRFAREISVGLEYLHGQDIIHGNLIPVSIHLGLDLTPQTHTIYQDNVLIDVEGRAVISDIGVDLALRCVSGLLDVLHPRFKWRAPEILTAEPDRLRELREGDNASWVVGEPTEAADVFSLGRTIHEIFCPTPPGLQTTVYDYIRDLFQGHLLDETSRPVEIPFGVWETLLECCSINPDQRPNAARVAGRLARVVIMT